CEHRSNIMRSLSLIGLAACAALGLPGNAVAQKKPQPLSHRLMVARPELERYLGQLREQALTPKRGGMSKDFLRAVAARTWSRRAGNPSTCRRAWGSALARGAGRGTARAPGARPSDGATGVVAFFARPRSREDPGQHTQRDRSVTR